MLNEVKHLGTAGEAPSYRLHIHVPGQILRYRSG